MQYQCREHNKVINLIPVQYLSPVPFLPFALRETRQSKVFVPEKILTAQNPHLTKLSKGFEHKRRPALSAQSSQHGRDWR